MNENIFDTHAHVLSPDLARYPYASLRGGATAPVSPMVVPVEQLVAAMDANGVAHACLVQRATLYGYDNNYALDAAEAFPERFVPVIVLDAQDPSSPAQLRDLVQTRNVAGLRIVAPTLTEYDTDWLEDAQALKTWAMAADLALPVTVILYRRNNAAGRSAMVRIAERFRAMPIIIDHVGLPHASTPERNWATAQGIDYVIPPPPDFGLSDNLAAFDALSHVHFKVTDINFDRLEDAHYDSATFLRALADRFGADRLLWGSDVGQSPAPYTEKIHRLRAATALLSVKEADSVMGGTAARLYQSRLKPNL